MPDLSTNFVRACSYAEPCPFCDTGGCVNRPRQTILTTYPTMPDPASKPLTPEQVEHWRKVLAGMLGPYALLMSATRVQEVRDAMQRRIDQDA